jgi:ATP-binding cassette subfamily C protein
MVFLKYLYRVIREQSYRLGFVALLMAAIALLESVTVALLVPLMNVVTGAGPSLSGTFGSVGTVVDSAFKFLHLNLTLVSVLGVIIVIFIVQGGFRLTMWHFEAKMLTRYEASLVNRLFQGYFNSSWNFFVQSRAGQLVNTLSLETGRATVALQGVCDVISGFFIALFYAIISLLLSWQITLIGLFLAVLASLILKRFMGKAYSYGAETTLLNNELQAYAIDRLAAAKLLKSSATEKGVVDKMSSIVSRKIHMRYLSIMNAALVPSIYQPLVITMLALVVFAAMTYFHTSLATILIFVYIFFRLSPYFSSLQTAFQSTLSYMPAVIEIDNALEIAKKSAEKKGGLDIKDFQRDIVFENVSFSYPDGKEVLKDANLQIKKGEAVAIIGESGMGKTTIVDLLLGLFAPQKGHILIDGAPLDTIDLIKWRELVGYISQDVFLFHDTIETNLKWLAPQSTKEQIEAAAQASYAHEFITDMPEGYRSIVGDRGVKLSGGQRQRLALARVMLRDAPILILDEATSALDSESEEKIRTAIDQYSANKTILVISHRSTILQEVDRVYLLANGTINEIKKNGAPPDNQAPL